MKFNCFAYFSIVVCECLTYKGHMCADALDVLYTCHGFLYSEIFAGVCSKKKSCILYGQVHSFLYDNCHSF